MVIVVALSKQQIIRLRKEVNYKELTFLTLLPETPFAILTPSPHLVKATAERRNIPVIVYQRMKNDSAQTEMTLLVSRTIDCIDSGYSITESIQSMNFITVLDFP